MMNSQAKYQLLPGPQTDNSRTLRLSLHPFLLIFLVATSALLGAVGGRYQLAHKRCPQSSYSNPEIPLNTQEQVFTYNRTFGADPQVNEQTIAAWDSIVPLGQGTVEYPPGSRNLSTVSVVHQLHCLWSLHQSYYAALHEPPASNDSHSHDHDHSKHARHCFDYLRQSLACAADSTLEPVDPWLGGVTGWGNVRVCRDYEGLKEWVARWRVSDARGFSDKR